MDSLTTVELPSLEARTFAGMFRTNVSMSSRLTFFENTDDRAVKFPIPISCDFVDSMTTTLATTTTTTNKLTNNLFSTTTISSNIIQSTTMFILTTTKKIIQNDQGKDKSSVGE